MTWGSKISKPMNSWSNTVKHLIKWPAKLNHWASKSTLTLSLKGVHANWNYRKSIVCTLKNWKSCNWKLISSSCLLETSLINRGSKVILGQVSQSVINNLPLRRLRSNRQWNLEQSRLRKSLSSHPNRWHRWLDRPKSKRVDHPQGQMTNRKE